MQLCDIYIYRYSHCICIVCKHSSLNAYEKLTVQVQFKLLPFLALGLLPFWLFQGINRLWISKFTVMNSCIALSGLTY